MRLYTAVLNGKEEIMAGFGQEEEIYLLSDLGLEFQDMNDLICHMTEEQKQGLYEMNEEGINA